MTNSGSTWDKEAPGRVFFMDMNAYYASIEQQENPELRGKPVIVAAVDTDHTCALAASYEAKALGVKTGTSVREAKRICPDIAVRTARGSLYLKYHRDIVETLYDHFVSVKVLSVDEMACRIDKLHNSPEGEVRLAREVKQHIAARLGACMRCSVGIAQNVFLAKVASDRQKPDGLTIYDERSLPQALFGLELIDLPGIGPRMAARLNAQGIFTMERLLELTPQEIHRAWGSVVGERWWHMLRGSCEADYPHSQRDVKKSVGHSHVLPPEQRTREGAQNTLFKLLSKCMKRLRRYGLAPGAVSLQAKFQHSRSYSRHTWKRGSAKHLPANDDMTWLRTVRPLVESMPPCEGEYRPYQVSIVFTDLIACKDMNLCLFDDPVSKSNLCGIVDDLNARCEGPTDLASVFWLRNRAPDRIAFGRPETPEDKKRKRAKEAGPPPGGLFYADSPDVGQTMTDAW